MQEQLHEQDRFTSINAGESIEEEHQITLHLKDKAILPKGYQWEEMGREFSHEGMFYDIVSLTHTQAGWELIATSDKEEAEIVLKQNKIQQTDKEIGGQQKSSKQKSNFSFSIYDLYVEYTYQVSILQLNQIVFSTLKDRLTHPYLSQVSPPPKAV